MLGTVILIAIVAAFAAGMYFGPTIKSWFSRMRDVIANAIKGWI